MNVAEEAVARLEGEHEGQTESPGRSPGLFAVDQCEVIQPDQVSMLLPNYSLKTIIGVASRSSRFSLTYTSFRQSGH